MKKTTREFRFASFVFDLLVDVVVVFVLVLFIRYFLFAPFRVHGPSMCDTFNLYNDECFTGDGEYVITSRLPLHDLFSFKIDELERGDVIIFQAPNGQDGEYYIKRIIGLPGEIIKVEDGKVYLGNSEGEFDELVEEYLSDENRGQTYPHKLSTETFEVPVGEYFVMGDNRRKSSDSRRCFKQLGCDDNSSPYLDEELIEGKVVLVIFPFTHFRPINGVDYSI